MEFFQKPSRFPLGTRFALYARLTNARPELWRHVGTLRRTAAGLQIAWAPGTAAVAAIWLAPGSVGTARDAGLGYVEFGVAHGGRPPGCVARRARTADVVQQSRHPDAGPPRRARRPRRRPPPLSVVLADLTPPP